MDKDLIVQLEQQEHVYNEKQIMAELNHPFLTKLHATFKTTRYLCMLLELSNGGELFGLLVEMGYLKEEDARFYAGSILLAVEYLHMRSIAYRDLKPENILLDSNGFVKLVDFGFAKKIVERTFTLCGTPDYLAPEIILNSGHGEEVDWWALGIFIYEMLAGFTPFTEENSVTNDVEIYGNILRKDVIFPGHFSASASNLIKKLCHRDPAKRCGWATGNVRDAKRHRWFRGFDWQALIEVTMAPPYIPTCDCPMDISNFDTYQSEDDDAILTELMNASAATSSTDPNNAWSDKW